MKKLLWVIVVVAIASFVVWSNDPLNETVNFIIGGSIPGTKTSLGFWPTMAIIASIILLIRRSLSNARLKMIEKITAQNKAEQAVVEFEEQNTGNTEMFDRAKRSVIEASSKPVS